MPFKSDKQRRYLWANEPEIARDWTNKYGNRIQKNGGGILQLVKSGPGRPGYNGQGDTGTYGKAGQSYGDRERYTSTDVTGPPNIHGGTTRTIGPTTPKDTFQQSWTGPSRFFGLSGGYKNLNVPGDTSQGHQSRFGIGNLFRGAASMFGGWPGKAMSLLSRIDPRQLRGKNPDGSWRTQQQYEDARTGRRNTKRMDYLSDRKSRGLGYGKKAYADLLGQGYSDTFQEALNRDLQINPETTQFSRSPLQSLANKQALTNQLSTPKRSLGEIVMDARRNVPTGGIMDNYNYSNMPMMEVANNPDMSRYRQELAPTKFHDPWAGAKVQQAKTYGLQDLKNLGAGYEGYTKWTQDPNKQLQAIQDYYDAATKYKSSGLGREQTPGAVRDYVERMGKQSFSGVPKINMGMVPQDFLSEDIDFTNQKSPLSYEWNI